MRKEDKKINPHTFSRGIREGVGINKLKPRMPVILLLAVIAVLAATNAFTFYIFKTKAVFSGDSCASNYSFINPRFACGHKNVIDKKGYSDLKFKLESYIEEKKSENKADVVAVWFRDLESGPTFGINDRMDFIPASLLKLPMALTYFQLAEDLGILEPGHDLNMASVNTKGYGSIFRMLYNISFLDKEMSEKLLSLLARSYFDDGLRAGVPERVVIAHKFGERYLPDGTKQLHDCGIVYYPDKSVSVVRDDQRGGFQRS